MVKPLLKWLPCLALFALAAPAFSLIIVPTFDSSITNSPYAAAMEAAINAAIQAFQTNYTDSLTVNIKFVNDPTTSLGGNVTYYGTYSYRQYIAALWSRATSLNDPKALSQLP